MVTDSLYTFCLAALHFAWNAPINLYLRQSGPKNDLITGLIVVCKIIWHWVSDNRNSQGWQGAKHARIHAYKHTDLFLAANSHCVPLSADSFHPTLRCFTRGAHEQRFVLCHRCSTLTKVHLKALTWRWPATRLDCIHGKNSGGTLNPSDWLSPSPPPFSGCV